MRGGTKKNWIMGMFILIFCLSLSAEAQGEGSGEETVQIRHALDEKKQVVSELNKQIDVYQKKITETQKQKASLINQLELLQNRMTKTELEMDATDAQIDLTQAEISELETRLVHVQEELEHKREVLEHVLQKIQSEDDQFPLAIFYGAENFSEFFDRLEQLEQVNADLKETVDEVKETKGRMIEQREQEEIKRTQLEDLEETLKEYAIRLEEEVNTKGLLVSETRASEQRFQNLLSDLREEQAFIGQQIEELQSSLEKKIKPEDAVQDGQLAWPIFPSVRGISASYHDPEYPFRNLFEHSGIDIPAPTGTAIRSAAPGYVAWTRRGPQYGNYVMVIHSDGLATLYAHLSRVSVVADQYVARGDQIGLVGMTGLTTGPHVHFEVRKKGIPTDPLAYLPTYD